MTIDVSYDSETWVKRPGGDIRSMGACVFDLNTGEIRDTFYLACSNPLVEDFPDDVLSQLSSLAIDLLDGRHRRYNLKRDPSTVGWWNKQSDEAKAAFSDPVDLYDALVNFSKWLTDLSSDVKYGQVRDIRIWTHGAAFDLPILEYVYHELKIPVPWFYRAPRDTRTAFDFANISNHSAWMKEHNQGTLHHAFYDATTQAKAISAAYSMRQL